MADLSADARPVDAVGGARRETLAAASVYVALLAILLVTWPGWRTVYDVECMVRVTESVLWRGTFLIDEPKTGERRPSVYGLGQSILFLPAVLLAHVLAPLLGQSEPVLARVLASATNTFVLAGVGTLLYRLGRRLQLLPGASFVLAILAVFGTPLWVQSQYAMSEPTAGLFLLGAILVARFGRGTRAAVLAGLLSGLSVLTRPAMLLTVPAVGLGASLREAPLATGVRGRILALLRGGLVFAVGFAPILGGQLAYNRLRFATVAVTNNPSRPSMGFHTPVLEGLQGLMLSEPVGLAWYAPVAFVGSFFLVLVCLRDPRLGLMLAGGYAMHVVLHAKWDGWMGAFWGPRLLVPVMPLAVAGIAPLLRSRAAALLLVLPVGLLSVAVSAVGALHNPRHTWMRLKGTGVNDLVRVQFDLLAPHDLARPSMAATSGTFWPTFTWLGMALLVVAGLSLVAFRFLHGGRVARTAVMLAAVPVLYLAARETFLPYRVMGRSLRPPIQASPVPWRGAWVRAHRRTLPATAGVCLPGSAGMGTELAFAPGVYRLRIPLEGDGSGASFRYDVTFGVDAVASGSASPSPVAEVVTRAVRVIRAGVFPVALHVECYIGREERTLRSRDWILEREGER